MQDLCINFFRNVVSNREELDTSTSCIMTLRCSLQCRRILARLRATAFDQASAILDSNSEEAWGETKMHPREWELGRKEKLRGKGQAFSSIFPHPLPTHFSQVNMAANLRSRALKKKTPALQANFDGEV